MYEAEVAACMRVSKLYAQKVMGVEEEVSSKA